MSRKRIIGCPVEWFAWAFAATSGKRQFALALYLYRRACIVRSATITVPTSELTERDSSDRRRRNCTRRGTTRASRTATDWTSTMWHLTRRRFSAAFVLTPFATLRIVFCSDQDIGTRGGSAYVPEIGR
jgi:hypothetical protein